MCVAIIVPKSGKVPTAAQLEDMHKANPHGIGVAWIDKGKRLCWMKGIENAQDLYGVIASLPKPCLIHFRLASVGGTHESLTHPFPITLGAELDSAGTASQVLIHNGHWGGYESALHALPRKELPRGRMSDTRLMAFLAARNGPKILKWLGRQGQKIATLSDRGIVTQYGSWAKVDGFIASNIYWDRKPLAATFDWGHYLKNRDEHKAVVTALPTLNAYSSDSYDTWEDTYVPRSLHRMTERELIMSMDEEGGEG